LSRQDEKDRRELREGEEELGVHGGHVRRRVQTSQQNHCVTSIHQNYFNL